MALDLDPTSPHGVLVELGLAFGLLVASVLIAGESEQSANIMIAVWGTLLLIWSIHHFSQ